jgi:hypothetical protein
LTSAFVYAVRGSWVTQSAMWSVMPLTYYAETRLATTKALATNLAVQEGLGKGEFGGLQANLRAFVSAVAPFLYASVYRSGVKAGRPGAPYLCAALAMLAAEFIHRKLHALTAKQARAKEL